MVRRIRQRHVWMAISAVLLCGTSLTVAAAPTDLMTVYIHALDTNPYYQAAVATYHQASEAHPQALAKLLPQIAASGDVDRAEQSVSGQFFLDQPIINHGQGISSNRDDYFNRYGYTVGLDQVLFHWDLFLGLDQADLKVAAAKLRLLQAQNKLRIGVASAYFGVLAARGKQRYAQAEHDALTNLAKQTQNQFQAGLLSEADAKQAQAAADQAQAELISANNALRIAQAQLALVAGESYPQLRKLPDNIQLPSPQPDNVQTWITHARTQNISVAVHKLQVRIAHYGVKMAEAKHLPTLDFLAVRDYGYATGGIANGIGAGNNHKLDQRVLLKLKIPIFSGGAVASAARAAFDGFERAKALERASQGQAVHDINVDFLNVQSDRIRISALRKSVSSAKAAETAARTDYESGINTYGNLLTALQRRYQAESNYEQARYAYLLSTLKLKDAAGSLSSDDLQKINQWLQ